MPKQATANFLAGCHIVQVTSTKGKVEIMRHMQSMLARSRE